MKITKKQLKSINGIGNRFFIAYKNKIYDVSDSELFRFGLHFNHEAGEDWTEYLADTPHGEEVLEKFPVIGELV